MDAKKVIAAAFNYLEKNMVPGMSNLQEIAFYSVKEAINEEADNLLDMIKSKPVARAIAAMDKDGNVDVEKLFHRLQKGFESKGSLELDIPLYGKVRFVPADIDNIFSELKVVEYNENHQRNF